MVFPESGNQRYQILHSQAFLPCAVARFTALSRSRQLPIRDEQSPYQCGNSVGVTFSDGGPEATLSANQVCVCLPPLLYTHVLNEKPVSSRQRAADPCLEGCHQSAYRYRYPLRSPKRNPGEGGGLAAIGVQAGGRRRGGGGSNLRRRAYGFVTRHPAARGRSPSCSPPDQAGRLSQWALCRPG